MSRLIRSRAIRFCFSIVLIALVCSSLTCVFSTLLLAQEAIPADKVLNAGAVNSAGEVPALTPEQVAQQREKFQEQMQDLWAKGLTVSVVDDASHRAVVYSNPGTEAEAIKHGTREQWLQRVNDPGYLMQQLRRREPAAGPDGFYWLARLQQELARGSGLAQNRSLPAYGPKSIRRPALSARDWNISLGAAGVPAAQYAAKYDSNSGTPSCLFDYVVFPVNHAGSSSQAMIVGANNVYNNCNNDTPGKVNFAYYYSTGGTVETSPTISDDGTKVAFVESITGGSYLHILSLGLSKTTGLGGGTSATSPALVPASTASCGNTALCDVRLALNASVTSSFPFYDFNSDSIYVGDDSGRLHYVHPVFCPGLTSCTPEIDSAATDGTGWPVTVSTAGGGTVLDAPAFDAANFNVYVGDSAGNAYYVLVTNTMGTSAGTCASGSKPCLGLGSPLAIGAGANGGIGDPPLLDLFAG
ncbi:MAG: hypothetical protein ABSD20_22280, partial [Terriglobales bacterium]